MMRSTASAFDVTYSSPNRRMEGLPGARGTTAKIEPTLSGPPKYTGSTTFAEGACSGKSVESFTPVARLTMKPKCFPSPAGMTRSAVWL